MYHKQQQKEDMEYAIWIVNQQKLPDNKKLDEIIRLYRELQKGNDYLLNGRCE